MAGQGRIREPMSYGPADLIRELGVSREAAERLEMHRRLVLDWSERMNLMGPKELEPERYWRRHVLDCAQLVRIAPNARRWVDLGSGAGFPGIILGCLMADHAEGQVHLVEATGKKARFLEEAAKTIGLPVRVFNLRIEDFGFGEGPYDVVTARALAPLLRILEHAKPILDRGAQGLFHKGADFDAELAAATNALSGGAYRADVLESLSDPRGRIVRIRKAA
ncbi:MAG: 16S rRNA (guanine(527)-N(7))-methyltransferase RsmG [Hyphomonadaceae bacterium]|nr:16S rRNA (guanine(527)-N(7))-methyltransferase RsmG [Hyphomonadaceae bacterium]